MSIISSDSASPMDTTTEEELELVAGNYRKLVLLVGMAIGFGVASLLLPSLLVAALVPFVSILFSVAAAFLAFRIMTGMGDRAPILWAIGMFAAHRSDRTGRTQRACTDVVRQARHRRGAARSNAGQPGGFPTDHRDERAPAITHSGLHRMPRTVYAMSIALAVSAECRPRRGSAFAPEASDR
jgi:hypothetical protein